MVKLPALAVPQHGSCGSSARAWRIWAARHAQSEARPLVAKSMPWVLELADFKSQKKREIDFTAFV